MEILWEPLAAINNYHLGMVCLYHPFIVITWGWIMAFGFATYYPFDGKVSSFLMGAKRNHRTGLM
jgi:hypothetical protein